MSHMPTDTENLKLYLNQMPALLNYTYAICRKIERPHNYIFAKCWNNPVKYVPYVSI